MDEGWRIQKRFGHKVAVPPLEKYAEVVYDPTDCLIVGRRFYSGAVIDTLVLGGWCCGTRFRSGEAVYEVDAEGVLVRIATVPAVQSPVPESTPPRP